MRVPLVLLLLPLAALAPGATALACFSPDQDVACAGPAVSLEGDATSCGGNGYATTCIAIAPHGTAWGYYGFSVDGESQAHLGASVLGDANCGYDAQGQPFDNCHAFSGTGDTIGAVSATGTGDARACRTLGCVAASGTGNANSGMFAASGTGTARGFVAVSATGTASCTGPLGAAPCVAVSGCDALAVCYDPA